MTTQKLMLGDVMVAVAGDMYQLNLEGGNSNVLLPRYGRYSKQQQDALSRGAAARPETTRGKTTWSARVSSIVGLGCGRQ